MFVIKITTPAGVVSYLAASEEGGTPRHVRDVSMADTFQTLPEARERLVHEMYEIGRYGYWLDIVRLEDAA